ncbi:MAG: bifunctional phosphopantothenoylcysteine decarboxylase/phosphopantothenate--cysteine ligase CoaBC [Lachnospirales bacterium]
MLKGKNVVIGVTGSIAAYKSASLCHLLSKMGADVNVVMTKNATEIIAPITFERLTNNKCIIETFDKTTQYDIKHISLAKKADIFVIAPATANIIGKIANGIADDFLSTTVMAAKCPVYIAPAMNTNMYENPIVQDNIKKLKSYGYKFIEPTSGLLACGDVGKGKMEEPENIAKYVIKELYKKDLEGKKILVTAGATCEAIDPVRFITNHSTGKMGCAISKMAMLRGAEVTLVCGNMSVEPPDFVNIINVKSAEEMFNAVKDNYDKCDIVIKAAAVADYTPVSVSDNKIKKKDGDMKIDLKRTKDILKYLGENKKNQFLCGFSMETENLISNSKAKLEKKNLDMVVANNLMVKGAGFGTDTNVITIITKDNVLELPIMSKDEAANKILDKIKELKK